MAANITENTHVVTVYILIVFRNSFYNISIQLISPDISQSMYYMLMNMCTDTEVYKADCLAAFADCKGPCEATFNKFSARFRSLYNGRPDMFP